MHFSHFISNNHFIGGKGGMGKPASVLFFKLEIKTGKQIISLFSKIKQFYTSKIFWFQR